MEGIPLKGRVQGGQGGTNLATDGAFVYVSSC